MLIVDIDNWYYCVHLLLISTTRIVDINNVRTLLQMISTIEIVDISSLIGLHERNNTNCRYRQSAIAAIPIVDINK